jgi:hypothetical protein
MAMITKNKISFLGGGGGLFSSEVEVGRAAVIAKQFEKSLSLV